MKLVYEQRYVPYVDVTIIMKSIYDENREQISYTLSGYYFGEPDLKSLEIYKDSLKECELK